MRLSSPFEELCYPCNAHSIALLLPPTAFRVRLFGPFITKLPQCELARHEDVPLPESSAEPYHRGIDDIDAKLFIPGQNLNGVMIPSTGEYNAISLAAP